ASRAEQRRENGESAKSFHSKFGPILQQGRKSQIQRDSAQLLCEDHAPMSIAARLNRLPPIPAHRAATIVAGIGAFFDLFDIFLAGVLSTVLTREFNLSRFALPAVIGSGFLGMFFGATWLGRFADHHGRRTAFLLNLGIYSGFTLLGAFSVNA